MSNSLLKDLAHDKSVGEVEEVLCAILRADAVEFHYLDNDRKVRSDANASDYIVKEKVELRARFSPAGTVRETSEQHGEPPAGEDTSASNKEDTSASNKTAEQPSRVAPELERFIRDLDNLERRSEKAFVWIKFLVQERIPQLGIAAAEASDFLNTLLRDEVVMTKKVPNPNRPDFPSTSVMLNRGHPLVRRVLAATSRTRFQPIKISGPPLSEDLIRDRQARG